MKKFFLLFVFAAFCFNSNAQTFSKLTGKKDKAYRDSIKQVEYAYVLPLMGEKVRKKGYSLPQPAGLMLGTYWQKQNLLVSNLEIGIGDGDDLVNIDDWTDFESITTENLVFTVRPDVWILPFMNLYATLSTFNALTTAHLIEPIELQIPEIEKKGQGVGFGTVLVYGIGKFWISENVNMAWSKAPGVDKPTQSFVNTVRVGTQVHSTNRKHFGTIWVGANYQNYLGSNSGAYDMSQLLPDDTEGLEKLKDKVQGKIDDIQGGYEDFCNTPGNGPACIVIDEVLTELRDRIDDKLDGIERPDEFLLAHGYNVEPERKWNMTIGTQYTFNRNWEARLEYGFIGRKSFVFNVNRRFGFKKKK